MPRVAIDVNSVIPCLNNHRLNGIGRTTKELVEHIAPKVGDAGIEVVLYSQNMHGIDASGLHLNLPCAHLSMPYRENINRLLSYTRAVQRATKYDILHIPHNFAWVNKPEQTVVTMHDAMFFSYPEQHLNHRYARSHYPVLAQQCRAIITCSQSSKRDIVQYLGVKDEKITVIPWGCNRDVFNANREPEVREQEGLPAPYFMMVSCDIGRKNTFNLIQSYNRFIKQVHADHKLLLLWSNPPREIVSYCAENGLNDRIVWTADVDDRALARLYRHATATFFPSRYEGFGLPVLESMSCGTPVVTCKNSSLQEVGGDAALYVSPDDIDEMAALMTLFEHGSIDRQALSRNSLDQADKFSWDRSATQTLALYRQCLC